MKDAAVLPLAAEHISPTRDPDVRDGAEHTPDGGLGEMLKALRGKARLTQEQLAGLASVSVRTVRGIELGTVQQPRPDTSRLLADALGLNSSQRAIFELAANGEIPDGGMSQALDLGQAVPPAVLGPMLGRQPELRALTELLNTDGERLLTVVGINGVGKTRLVLEAAHQMHDTTNIPVVWVGLETDALSPDRQFLGADRIREVFVSGDRCGEFGQVLGSKPVLLVLDGCDALPAEVSYSLHKLLNACPQLRVVITTREPYARLGGRVLPLAPLGLPGQGAAPEAEPADVPSIALMMSYLGHLRPDIPPTKPVAAIMADICHALDGIPQALESAASWLSLYAPSQLKETAESAPLGLTLNLQAPHTDTRRGFQQALERSISRLEPAHWKLLRIMAAGKAPWDLDTLAQRIHCEPAEIPRSLHALILRGLVRPVRHDRAQTTFVVLNLVRHVVATEDDAPWVPATS